MFSPDDTFEFRFGESAGKPDSERPALVFRHMTRRESRKLGEALDHADLAATYTKCDKCGHEHTPRVNSDNQIDFYLSALKPFIKGWKNIDGDYDPDRLDDLLDDADVIELRRSLRAEMRGDRMKKKESALQSASSAGQSAPDATPAVA